MFLSYKLFFAWPCLYYTLSRPPNQTFGFENSARNIKALLRLYNAHMGNWRQNGLSTQDIGQTHERPIVSLVYFVLM